MGKPYATEMLQLRRTAEWGAAFEIEVLRQMVLGTRHLPLMAVGSGGSLTAAHFLAAAHRHYTGQVAQVSTPLDVAYEPLARRTAAWLLSAGGGNVDILASFATLAAQEPAALQVLVGRRGSPLAARVNRLSHVRLAEFAHPAGKDGFLATNSLLAFCLLIGRAYEASFRGAERSPPDIAGGLLRLLADDASLTAWRAALAPHWDRDDLVVLHGAATRIGAIDIESKFTEAALGRVQVADYRNFAHGRHVWLAKRGGDSAVLALTTPADRDLAVETLAQLPAGIPVARIDLEGEFLESALASLVVAFQAAAFAGAARGIDPGRPGVPEFGRALYHLRPAATVRRASQVADAMVAIERKSGTPIASLEAAGTLASWQGALAAFQAEVAKAPFRGVVFDYDGTLVETRDRYQPPIPDVVEALARLLEHGVLVGIATGRGGSVAEDLRKVLPPETWPRVIVGYYNGSEIGSLDETDRPDATAPACDELGAFLDALGAFPQLADVAELRVRRRQVTLEARGNPPEDRLWDIANQARLRSGSASVTVARSGHSVDVLAPGVAKTDVIAEMRRVLGMADARILKVGDRGRWPGNDFRMLAEPHALSVDETSPDPATCWNLAPRGLRGIAATLAYCARLEPHPDGGVTWRIGATRR